MPNVNLPLYAACDDARTVCREKLRLLQAAFGDHDPEVRTLHDELEQVFVRFDNPLVWTRPIGLDSVAVIERAHLLRTLDEESLAGLILHIREMLHLLQPFFPLVEEGPELLDDGFESVGNDRPLISNSLNPETINARLLAQRKIDERVLKFKAAGTDLLLDPEFVKMKVRLEDVSAKFDAGLRSGDITGTANDIAVLNVSGNTIANVVLTPNVPTFKVRYKRHSDFIEGRLPAPHA